MLVLAGGAATADADLVARFPAVGAVPVGSLPPLGSVPTIYVNLDPVTMAEFLRKDREEGRRLYSRQKPSHLERFITKQKFMPLGNSSGNGFSQTNPYICITTINAVIPAWNNVSSPPSSYGAPVNASRACTANPALVPVVRNSTAMNILYASYGVTVHVNTTHKVQLLMPTGQTPSPASATTEPASSWGIAFYDTNGNSDRLQEVVWVNGSYLRE